MSTTELAGRHVVVTGGAGALGQVVVARLLEAGAICHLPLHRDAAPGAGHSRLHVTANVDLTDEAAVARFYEALPGLWASVHLAGGFAMTPLATGGRTGFMHMIEINALSCFLCCRAAVGLMRGGGMGGRIVNVAARPALEPRKGARMLAYAAAKAAVATLTQALAEEVKEDHILVNAIAPSTIDTPANRAAMPKADPAKWLSPDAAAETILHLVSPANNAVSGAVLPLYARA